VTVTATTQALLDLVGSDRDRRTRELHDAAHAEAAATVGQAHAEARTRVRDAYADARERHQARVVSAQAELATRRRLAQQRHVGALLAEGMNALPGELARRWREPSLRADWVAHVVGAAKAVLPRGAWRIVHAPDWPATERDAIGDALVADLGAPPAFVADPRIGAGLAVSASGNVVDGTLEGLLVDRTEVEAQLLTELQRPSATIAPREPEKLRGCGRELVEP
jgi:hypothetical protein